MRRQIVKEAAQLSTICLGLVIFTQAEREGTTKEKGRWRERKGRIPLERTICAASLLTSSGSFFYCCQVNLSFTRVFCACLFLLLFSASSDYLQLRLMKSFSVFWRFVRDVRTLIIIPNWLGRAIKPLRASWKELVGWHQIAEEFARNVKRWRGKRQRGGITVKP